MFYLIKIFFKGSRLHTLVAIWLPVSLTASLVAATTHQFDSGLFILMLVSGSLCQISANFFNDAYDLKSQLDLKKPKDLRRATFDLSFSQIIKLALFSSVLAFIVSWPLIQKSGILIFILAVLSLFFSWLYSGSKISLAKTGLSELFVILFFGFGACYGSYYIFTGTINESLIYLSLGCGFWSTILLLVNYIRDRDIDKESGRKNLITLYGKDFGLLVIGVLLILIYLLCFYWLNKLPRAGAFAFSTCILSCFWFYNLTQARDMKGYNSSLKYLLLLQVCFGASFIFGAIFR